jgi:membrane dipeptidase
MARSPSDLWTNQLSVEALQAAGISLVVAAVWTPPTLRPGRAPLDETFRQLRLLRRQVEQDPRWAFVTSAAQGRKLIAQGRIAVFVALEGAGAVRDPADLDRLYAAGVRFVQPVHFSDNPLGQARPDQLGPLSFGSGATGLTPLGREAVQRALALGMVVDVDHASEATVAEVLAMAARRGAPVIASHVGGARGAPRTLGDEAAARVARTGGLIGVGIYRHPLLEPVPAQERWAGFVEGSCDETVAHWVHYAKLAPGAVVLGSDLNSPILRGAPGGLCPDGIRNAWDLPALFAALAPRLPPGASLDDMAERVLAAVAQAERVADRGAQDAALGRLTAPSRSRAPAQGPSR